MILVNFYKCFKFLKNDEYLFKIKISQYLLLLNNKFKFEINYLLYLLLNNIQ